MAATDDDAPTARERHVQRVKHLHDGHRVSITPEARDDSTLLGALASYHAGLHFPGVGYPTRPAHDHDPDELAADMPKSVRAFVDGARGADFPHGG